MDKGGWRALDELRAAGVVAAIGAGVNECWPCERLMELADPDVFLLAGRYTLLEQGVGHVSARLRGARDRRRDWRSVQQRGSRDGCAQGRPALTMATRRRRCCGASRRWRRSATGNVPLPRAALAFPLRTDRLGDPRGMTPEMARNVATLDERIPDDLGPICARGADPRPMRRRHKR